jgi:hypothetical protein
MRFEELLVARAAGDQHVAGRGRGQLGSLDDRTESAPIRARPFVEPVLEVVRAEDAQAPARTWRREDGMDEREVGHDGVAPGEPLAQPRRHEDLAGGCGGRAEGGGEPERRQGERIAAELGHEPEEAAIDVLLDAARPRLHGRRAPRHVVLLAPHQGMDEDVEALPPERPDQGEAAEVPA